MILQESKTNNSNKFL